MFAGKLKYIPGILMILLLLAVMVGGTLFFKTKTKESTTINRSEILGLIHELGGEEEFTIQKDGEIVFQNKAGDLPKIKYRLVHRYKTTAASWEDLREGDEAILNLYYDNRGQLESRVLKIYRPEE